LCVSVVRLPVCIRLSVSVVCVCVRLSVLVARSPVPAFASLSLALGLRSVSGSVSGFPLWPLRLRPFLRCALLISACAPFAFASASLHALPPLFSAAVVAAPPLSDRFGRGIGIGNLGTGFSDWLLGLAFWIGFLGFFFFYFMYITTFLCLAARRTSPREEGGDVTVWTVPCCCGSSLVLGHP
jgi:hypothetical protein